LWLQEIVMYLHMLPPNKKNVPDLIRDPVSLIQDVRTLIGLHRQDSRELAITGRPVLSLPDDGDHRKSLYARPYMKSNGMRPSKPSFKSKSGAGPGDKGGPRRRRTRCKKCEACQRSDCGECSFCLDMVKFGGPGRAKQTCNMRQCLQPMLPVTAACVHCGLDGWNQTPVTPLQKGPQRCESASNLMECSVSSPTISVFIPLSARFGLEILFNYPSSGLIFFFRFYDIVAVKETTFLFCTNVYRSSLSG
jgi:F-box/leucine-rich repeat protein 10/11